MFFWKWRGCNQGEDSESACGSRKRLRLCLRNMDNDGQDRGNPPLPRRLHPITYSPWVIFSGVFIFLFLLFLNIFKNLTEIVMFVEAFRALFVAMTTNKQKTNVLLWQTHLELRHSALVVIMHLTLKWLFMPHFMIISECVSVSSFLSPVYSPVSPWGLSSFSKSNKRLTFLKRLIFGGFYFCSSALLIIIDFLRSFYFCFAEVKLCGVQVFHL